MRDILYIFSAYIIGGIPFALIIVKVFSKVDIRDRGSGNVGATNVLRVVGAKAGLIVLLLDILKGFLILFFAPLNISYLAGLAVIAGHCWTPFLNFKGGKGVATTLGVLLAIDPVLALYVLLIWVAVFALSKIVSLSSLLAAIFLPLILLFKSEEPLLVLYIGLYSAIIIFRHKANLIRLIRAEERKINFKKGS
jgi:acyl phosphate:glycerol-3-phosphate acyltransferase